MPQALPLTDMISPSSTRKRGYRTIEAKFGDGYGQAAPDGINDVVDTWALTFEFLNLTDRATLVAALDAVKSWDYLTWTAPGDATVKRWKVTREGWSETTSGLLSNISFNVEQVF